MKKIRVGNGYITNIELSCGELIKIDIGINAEPVSFNEEDAIEIKTKLEEYYKNKDATLKVDIIIENI